MDRSADLLVLFWQLGHYRFVRVSPSSILLSVGVTAAGTLELALREPREVSQRACRADDHGVAEVAAVPRQLGDLACCFLFAILCEAQLCADVAEHPGVLTRRSRLKRRKIPHSVEHVRSHLGVSLR